jgi:two-component system, cell cycle sensor histidine kinase and response regulator CckA
MSGIGVVTFLAGALQLFVPTYALRLVRRFGAQRVGWFVVAAISTLAVLHLLGVTTEPGLASHNGISLELFFIAASVLLLIGMGHLHTTIVEHEQRFQHEQSLRTTLERKSKEEATELARTNQSLIDDLARHEETETRLKESAAQYQLLFINNPQPMCIFDLRTCRFLAANQAALQQYGFTLEEFVMLTARDLVPADGVASFLRDVARPCAGAQARGIWRHRRKNGTLIEVEMTAIDLMFERFPARLVLVTDIGERRRREAELCHTGKMKVVGEVAAGVAHHFNNLLTIISGYASILLEKLQDRPLLEPLQHIGSAAHRGAMLTRQLLIAAGRQSIRAQPLDLNAVIRNHVSMLRRLLGPGIVLREGYGSCLGPVLADPNLVEHILVHLVHNARDAMPTGGVLSISTSAARRNADPRTNNPQLRPGEFVCIAIRDSGSGMTPEVRARLFEPFFTTKDVGKATGLGLASVYGAVKQQGGTIEVTTEVNAGTEFRIFLPRAADSSLPAQDQAGTSLRPATVLLVEPEDRQRGLARHILQRNGHLVVEADSGSVALVLWESRAAEIDVLLTDFNLGGEITGSELAVRLQKAKPGLKVIYSLASNPVQSQRPASDGVPVICKPYVAERLTEALKLCSSART